MLEESRQGSDLLCFGAEGRECGRQGSARTVQSGGTAAAQAPGRGNAQTCGGSSVAGEDCRVE